VNKKVFKFAGDAHHMSVRLAIPTWSDEGLDSEVHPRPLGSPFMAIIEVRDKEAKLVEIVRNPISSLLIPSREISLASWLKSKRIDILISSKPCSSSVVEKLMDWEIGFQVIEGKTVKDIMDKYLKGVR
jgi:predicted Fe-Mo cluster-binding NifX family protein